MEKTAAVLAAAADAAAAVPNRRRCCGGPTIDWKHVHYAFSLPRLLADASGGGGHRPWVIPAVALRPPWCGDVGLPYREAFEYRNHPCFGFAGGVNPSPPAVAA